MSGFDFEDKTIFVRNREQDISPWDRTKIVAILMDESGIPFKIAEEIADEVQKTVFSLDIKTVSSSLLRELVNAKLIEKGYSKILNKTRRLGLSTSDVKDIIFSPVPYFNYSPSSPDLSSAYISGTVKRQYAAFNVFPEKLVNLHYQGRLHINGIDGVDRIYDVVVDCGKLLNFSYSSDNFFVKKPKTCGDFFSNLLKVILFLNRFVNNDIVVTGIEKAFMYFDCCSEKERIFTDFLKKIDSVFISEKPVRIFLKDNTLVKSAKSYYSDNFSIKSEIVATPKSYLPSMNIGVLSRIVEDNFFVVENITLNLPGIALDSKVNGKDFFKYLKKITENVFSLFAKKGIFVEKMLSKKGTGVYDFLKSLNFNPLSAHYVVSVCGLQECVSLLREKAKFSSDDIDFAFDILSFLKDIIENLSREYRINSVLGDSDQSDSSYRFARLDLKFEPYYMGKVVKGDISSGGVYYSHNSSFLNNHFIGLGEGIDIENRLNSIYSIPFKTVVRIIDLDNIRTDFVDDFSGYLMLTRDFSVCYHCNVMKGGLYKTCPECLSGNIANYFYLYSNYSPLSKLNRGLTVMMKNIEYYEDFTI